MAPSQVAVMMGSYQYTVIVFITLVAAIIVMALILAAHAQSLDRNYPILPPLEYDRPYTGKLRVTVVPTIKEVMEHCDLAFPSALACTLHRGELCIIIILPDDTLYSKGWDAWHVMRHEMGHCNGWRGNHIGARVPTREDDRRWKKLLDEYLTSSQSKALEAPSPPSGAR
jgi:hypothetical protein